MLNRRSDMRYLHDRCVRALFPSRTDRAAEDRRGAAVLAVWPSAAVRVALHHRCNATGFLRKETGLHDIMQRQRYAPDVTLRQRRDIGGRVRFGRRASAQNTANAICADQRELLDDRVDDLFVGAA